MMDEYDRTTIWDPGIDICGAFLQQYSRYKEETSSIDIQDEKVEHAVYKKKV